MNTRMLIKKMSDEDVEKFLEGKRIYVTVNGKEYELQDNMLRTDAGLIDCDMRVVDSVRVAPMNPWS